MINDFLKFEMLHIYLYGILLPNSVVSEDHEKFAILFSRPHLEESLVVFDNLASPKNSLNIYLFYKIFLS